MAFWLRVKQVDDRGSEFGSSDLQKFRVRQVQSRGS
jgi:hypothetical protein